MSVTNNVSSGSSSLTDTSDGDLLTICTTDLEKQPFESGDASTSETNIQQRDGRRQYPHLNRWLLLSSLLNVFLTIAFIVVLSLYVTQSRCGGKTCTEVDLAKELHAQDMTPSWLPPEG